MLSIPVREHFEIFAV